MRVRCTLAARVAARRIADAICLARSSNTLPKRTREFATLVAEAKGHEYQPMHSAKLTFQALRIHLNDEFGELRKGIRSASELLYDGGRIGLLTWKHSECAIVIDEYRGLEAVRAESPLSRWYQQQLKSPGGGGGGVVADAAHRLLGRVGDARIALLLSPGVGEGGGTSAVSARMRKHQTLYSTKVECTMRQLAQLVQ